MNTTDEVQISSNFLKTVMLILLFCIATVHTRRHFMISTRWMTELNKYSPVIGYSGHERGISVSIASVALGANIERHITLDREMEGPDHAASLEPEEFTKLVQEFEVELALGNSDKRTLSQGEIINRENLGKSLMAANNLKKGAIISSEDIKVRSPGQGLSPQMFDELVGVRIDEIYLKTTFSLNQIFYKIKLSLANIISKGHGVFPFATMTLTNMKTKLIQIYGSFTFHIRIWN